MWEHFARLAARSWSAMVSATGTSTLGLIIWTVSVTAVLWFAGVAAKWWRSRKESTSSPFIRAIEASVAEGVFSIAAVAFLALVAFAWFTVSTIYGDHQYFVDVVNKLKAKGATTRTSLEFHRHTVSTDDPVFANVIYMLGAFRAYRVGLGGKKCVIYVTAPPETQALASTFAQLSNTTSDCYTFGPTPPGNPDLDELAVDGMMPTKILIHRDRDNVAAGRLAITLGNQIQVQETYRQPKIPKLKLFSLPPGEENIPFIWMQFGSKVDWNSSLYDK